MYRCRKAHLLEFAKETIGEIGTDERREVGRHCRGVEERCRVIIVHTQVNEVQEENSCSHYTLHLRHHAFSSLRMP